MTAENRKILTLSSDFEELERVESFVDDLQGWLDFDEELYGNIMLTLSEAVTNAIVHGNQSDESKEVRIDVRNEGERVSISVKDEGTGFDPDSLPDPLKDENLLKEGGRGVYLIEQFADEVVFTENGTRITFYFLL